MRLPVLRSLVALLPGCTSMSTQMADDEGDVIKCEARGFGLIGAGRVALALFWRPRRESNPYLALRRRSFYPLNYGGL